MNQWGLGGDWPDQTATRAATHRADDFAPRPRIYFRVVSCVFVVHPLRNSG